MPRVTFVEPGGARRQIDAPAGRSLLEVAHDNGVEIEGACDGCMACSTCHVIVEARWFDRLPPPSEEEDEILDLAPGLTATSRLGCQIRMAEDLDGLVVRLPALMENLLL